MENENLDNVGNSNFLNFANLNNINMNMNMNHYNSNTNQIENFNMDIITMISQLETPIDTEKNFIKTFEDIDLNSNTEINKQNYKNAYENINNKLENNYCK